MDSYRYLFDCLYGDNSRGPEENPPYRKSKDLGYPTHYFGDCSNSGCACLYTDILAVPHIGPACLYEGAIPTHGAIITDQRSYRLVVH